MSKTKEILELLRALDKTPLAAKQSQTQYCNKGKVDELFSKAIGFTKVEQMAVKSDEAELKAEAEGEVSTGILSWFLKLRAGIIGSIKTTEGDNMSIAREIKGWQRMALAEAALQRDNLVEDVRKRQKPSLSKHYLRFYNVFEPFNLNQDDDDYKDELKKLEKLLGSEGANIVLNHKKKHERGDAKKPQFVYATADPFPMASILFVPLSSSEDSEIWGSTWACYTPDSRVDRIYFGVLRGKEKEITFVELYYVLDVFTDRSIA